MKSFKALDIKTGEYTEYSMTGTVHDEFSSFIEALMHVEARTGRKATAYMTTSYFDALRKSELENYKNGVIAGIPCVVDDEQEFDLVFKY